MSTTRAAGVSQGAACETEDQLNNQAVELTAGQFGTIMSRHTRGGGIVKHEQERRSLLQRAQYKKIAREKIGRL